MNAYSPYLSLKLVEGGGFSVANFPYLKFNACMFVHYQLGKGLKMEISTLEGVKPFGMVTDFP